jgi:hypothetical protein
MNIRGDIDMASNRSVTPRDFRDHGANVGDLAREFAQQDAVTSEALIASLVTQAIQQWRLDDATFWQRVKFQARLIRATPASGTVERPSDA